MKQLISNGRVGACRRMNRAVGALTLLYLFAVWNVPSLASTDVRSTVLYAPQPDYPVGARGRGWEGTGLFRCSVRPDGAVSSVIVLQSTGYEILDQAAIAAFHRWHFKPGTVKAVRIPLSFSMHRGIRHRMSGAVIAD
jgi:TonB family protein